MPMVYLLRKLLLIQRWVCCMWLSWAVFGCAVIKEAIDELKGPPKGVARQPALPTLLFVSAATPGLRFRYIARDADGWGAFGITDRIDAIPEAARRVVQVVKAGSEPESWSKGRYVQIFDLSAPGLGGAFPGRLIPRGARQSLTDIDVRSFAKNTIVRRRVQTQDVVIFTKTRCGASIRAMRYMDRKGIE
ncbi:MAG: glutaredoxin, partial [Phycisphaerales bacterium]|nr:glutaredoxin [Phycisphaerales bacterium]